MEMIAYARKGMQVNIYLLRFQYQETVCSDLTSGLGVPTVFCRLTGYQWDPRDLGVTAWYHNLGKRLIRELGCGYPQVWS